MKLKEKIIMVLLLVAIALNISLIFYKDFGIAIIEILILWIIILLKNDKNN